MSQHHSKLSENLEDYLEVIATLSAEQGSARITDIATVLSVKKPSVTAALNVLASHGLVEYERYKPVVLTQDGKALAQNVRRKHDFLRKFFTDILGVPQDDADIAACKMEHALDDSILTKFAKFVEGLNCSVKSPRSKQLAKKK